MPSMALCMNPFNWFNPFGLSGFNPNHYHKSVFPYSWGMKILGAAAASPGMLWRRHPRMRTLPRCSPRLTLCSIWYPVMISFDSCPTWSTRMLYHVFVHLFQLKTGSRRDSVWKLRQNRARHNRILAACNERYVAIDWLIHRWTSW